MKALILALCLLVPCSTLLAADAGVCPPPMPVPGTVVMSNMPTMVPVITSKAVPAQMSQGQNVLVLVPVTVSQSMMGKLTASKDESIAMVPVSVPVMMGSSSGAMMGAGPSRMTTDQLMASSNLAIMPMIPAVSLDQTMLDKIAARQPIMVDESQVASMATGQSPLMIMPVMVMPGSTSAMSGRGPSPMMMVDKQAMCTWASSPNTPVMIPMTVDRATMSKMLSDRSVALYVPVMTPVDMQKPTPQ